MHVMCTRHAKAVSEYAQIDRVVHWAAIPVVGGQSLSAKHWSFGVWQ